MPKKQTLEEFIKKSNIAHNFKYNYDKSIYINKQTKVIVTCPEHGDFEVTPGAHYILKSGCPECAKISRSKTKSKGLEKFLKECKNIYGDYYDLSKVNYVNNYTNIEIICPIHGSFFKHPRSFIERREGCNECNIIARQLKYKKQFIEASKKVHNNKYTYDNNNYVNFYTPCIITCPIHGDFKQRPINHLSNESGCPECARCKQRSIGEIELCEYIKLIYSGIVLENARNIIGKKELDIYLPDLKLAFEYDGEYWHKKKELEYPGYHEDKNNRCKEVGIKLLHITHKDWIKNQDETKSKIKETIKTLENNEAFKKKT